MFAVLPLPANLAIFALMAIAVWIAGAKMAAYAEEIAERSGIGHAMAGLLLLAGVTSLPEIATSFTSAINGDSALAVNNLLGSIAMQVAVLAVADMIYHDRALTSVVPDSIVILQGAVNVCLLSLTATAAITGDVPLLSAGAWSWALAAAAVFAFRLLSKARGRKPWTPNAEGLGEIVPGARSETLKDVSHVVLGIKTGLAALAILTAGSIVAVVSGVIAEQTGLGSSFVGVAFVAVATSLPEASTSFAAISRGAYTLAISDIFGTNVLNIALIWMVDILAAGDPVLSSAGPFAAVGAMLGVLVTGLFLVGLAERRDRTILRMGWDSAAVLLAYAGGLALLYTLRGTT